MAVELEIERMSLEEKLRAMEALWADLSRNAEQFESPPWHAQVLDQREQRVRSGQEQYEDWEAAKRELRNRFP
jgi:hypothetical protein